MSQSRIHGRIHAARTYHRREPAILDVSRKSLSVPGGIHRLTGETISSAPSKVNGSVGYGLDPVGNRLTTTSTISGINSGSVSFNPDDEVLIESYDGDGNRVAKSTKLGLRLFQNRMCGPKVNLRLL